MPPCLNPAPNPKLSPSKLLSTECKKTIKSTKTHKPLKKQLMFMTMIKSGINRTPAFLKSRLSKRRNPSLSKRKGSAMLMRKRKMHRKRHKKNTRNKSHQKRLKVPLFKILFFGKKLSQRGNPAPECFSREWKKSA